MQTVILAGGRGTRLKQLTGDLPKPLVDVSGKPLLQYQLELVRRSGIEDVLLLTGYKASKIKEVFGDGRKFGLKIGYEEEDENNPLGTAGALLNCLDRLEDRFFVLYGDCMVNVDLPRMLAWHETHSADASLLVHPNSHPQDSDLIEADDNNQVVAFHPYPHDRSRYFANLVNAALYIIEKRAILPYRDRWLREALAAKCTDIAKHLFPQMQADGSKLYAYRSPEYIKDAGTPARHASVLQALASGWLDRASLSHPQKAIFLDRDGTINAEVNRVSNPAAFEMLGGVAKAIHAINESEYRAIIITNQPILARGDADTATLAQIHAKMDTILASEGAYVDGLYYCPHHPDRGFPGEVSALKIDCDCRKPKSGLLLRAQTDFNIDFRKSWFIGDTTTDIETAARLGIRSILVKTGQAGEDRKYAVEPLYVFADLSVAVEFILSHHESLTAQAKVLLADCGPHDTITVTGDGDIALWRSLLRDIYGLQAFDSDIISTASFQPETNPACSVHEHMRVRRLMVLKDGAVRLDYAS